MGKHTGDFVRSGDKGFDAHRSAAFWAKQGVNFVDTLNKYSPFFSQVFLKW